MSEFNRDVWEYYGKETPYFAVVTENKFRTENLDKNAKDEFFSSGEEYVEKIWREIETNFVKEFKPKKTIDFGCGVGRLLIPLAKRSQNTIGIDISQKMLDETSKNCKSLGLNNVSFIQSDDNLSKLTEKVDFIHSFIVIQHIKPAVGEVMISKLIDALEDGGIGVLQTQYVDPSPLSSRIRYYFYREFPIVYKIRNLVLRKKNEPLIPVYQYNLNNIFRILQEKNCHKCLVRFSQHGHYGAVIFFQKQKEILY
jgi:2-polyprenyl-3-methyl-5-hydroxy-6-metoxy-1,4-benzoquinol methylase